MKKIILILVLSFGSGFTFAQQFNFSPTETSKKQQYDWKNMSPEQRKKTINSMSPTERMALLKEFRENMMVEELRVPADKQEEFKNLYSEYQEKHKEIKSKFSQINDYDNLSDDEAKKQLDQSFDIGQQFLNNRKEYCEKFMKVIKPQQVLKMFDTEGSMRNKIIDIKKGDGRPSKR